MKWTDHEIPDTPEWREAIDNWAKSIADSIDQEIREEIIEEAKSENRQN